MEHVGVVEFIWLDDMGIQGLGQSKSKVRSKPPCFLKLHAVSRSQKQKTVLFNYFENVWFHLYETAAYITHLTAAK